MIKLYCPGRQKFLELATEGKRIPVFKDIPLGNETLMGAIEKLGLEEKPFVLLESGKGTENLARYSFLAFDPWMTYRSKGNRVEILTDRELNVIEGQPFNELRKLFDKYQGVKYPGLPKFYGGALGYFSYDMGRFFEVMPESAEDDLEIPESYFMFFDKVLCFDHLEKTLKIIINVEINPGCNLEQAYFAATREIEVLKTSLQGEVRNKSVLPKLRSGLEYSFQPEANMEKADFEKIVEKAKEYIKAGDIFQVNLSIRLGKKTEVRPIDLYRVLREINPSPYMSYINFGDLQIVSCSPELLVRLTDEGVADTRPIAGTRKRGENRAEDLALAQELISNEKERAEHIMLVDLERNDLGRVCDYGTVEVNELMVIEEYSHVMHIVSNVRGMLAEGKDRFDLIRACFPGGTITGAPKIRSMEIIEELEPTRRGIYTGSIGFLGYGGEMEMNIVIRTLVIKEGMAYVQAGAGIVADSIPEKEYYESLTKAEALLRTLEAAEEIYKPKEEASSA